MAKKKQRKPRPLARGDGLRPAMKPVPRRVWESNPRPSVEEVDRVLNDMPRCEVAHSRDYHEPTLFDPSPLIPLYSTRDIHEYFVTSLGTPKSPGRLRELRGRQDWPLDSVCGIECVKAIDAAVTLLQCMRAAYGVHNHRAEAIREATLHICEVICFG